MIHVITLGFAPARIIRRGMEKFYETYVRDVPIKHWLVDQHYPLNREQNLKDIYDIVMEYSLNFIDSGRDRGLHNGLNFALERIKPDDGDIIVMYDPDGGPTTQNWLGAIQHTIKDCGYSVACAVHDGIMKELHARGHSKKRYGNLDVWEPNVLCMFSIWGAEWKFLKLCLPLHEENPYYGGLEDYLFTLLKRWDLKWGYLPQYYEETYGQLTADVEYTSWKWHHALFKTFPGSFAEFLAAGCPEKEPIMERYRPKT